MASPLGAGAYYHEYRTTNQYFSVHQQREPTGTVVNRTQDKGGYSTNFSITKYHTVSHEPPPLQRTLAVKNQPKPIHERTHTEQHRYQPEVVGCGETYVKTRAPALGYGRNNQGVPDVVPQNPGERRLNHLVLEKAKKSHPTDAENHGTGPTRFSTSMKHAFTPPDNQPTSEPPSGRVRPREPNGFTTNIPASIRPFTPPEDYTPLPTHGPHSKPYYPFSTGHKGSMNQSVHVWARPEDPLPQDAKLSVCPTPGPRHWRGGAVVPTNLKELSPYEPPSGKHPTVLKGLKVKDPVEYAFLTDPTHVGKPSSSVHTVLPETQVDSLVQFQTSRAAEKSAGFESNFSHHPHHRYRSGPEERSEAATTFDQKKMGHSLTGFPDHAGPHPTVVSGYGRSVFASDSSPTKGGMKEAKDLHPSVKKQMMKSHPYLFESRPCTERV